MRRYEQKRAVASQLGNNHNSSSLAAGHISCGRARQSARAFPVDHYGESRTPGAALRGSSSQLTSGQVSLQSAVTHSGRGRVTVQRTPELAIPQDATPPHAGVAWRAEYSWNWLRVDSRADLWYHTGVGHNTDPSQPSTSKEGCMRNA